MPRKHPLVEYVESVRRGRTRHTLTYSAWLKFVKKLTREEKSELFHNTLRSKELHDEYKEWYNTPWISDTWSGIPFRVYDTPLMNRPEYYIVADQWGYNRDFGELRQYNFLCWLSEDVEVIRNGVYGHRHWICLRNNRIVGLTVGSAGWITEKSAWEKAGFTAEVLENSRGARRLIIGKSYHR